MDNLFQLPGSIGNNEVVELLIPDKGVRIERIISTGQASPPGFWYEQERDEWVVLLQGSSRLSWESGRVRDLVAGDWVLIPSGEKHRVEFTSAEPPCLWLAIHFNSQ